MLYLIRKLKKGELQVMAEYIIKSTKYGDKSVLLDNDIYNMIVRCGFNLFLKKTTIGNIFYVVLRTRQIKGHRQYKYLHRLVMNNPNGLTVDHINHNTLDNRRCNLKVCTQFQNNQNNARTKIIPGVCKVGNRFKAYIDGTHLGTFKSKDEAIKARVLAERTRNGI